MKNYITAVIDPAEVPQSEALPNKKQVKNSAGGFVFGVDNWTLLERFLVLGSESNTYYATSRELTAQNVDGLKDALAEDGARFVRTVVEISHSGRAPKNDPALFALALAVADKRKEVSALALSELPKVARIPTHLFHFMQYVSSLRGFGRALRTGIADWYLGQPADKLARALSKYQSRDGWTNRDVLRLCHANPKSDDHKAILHWAVKGWDKVGLKPHPEKTLQPIWAFERAKQLKPDTDAKELVRLIGEYDLPRECIPTEFLNSVEVWDALLQKMPMTAMIRNLGKMTSIGLISPNSDAAKMVRKRLEDENLLHKARVHPISVLMAQSIYKAGHGMKGSLSWSPVAPVLNALDKAFYASFANAPKTGKRFYIGLDVSGSMGSGNVAGTPLSPREAAAAMAMVTMRTEEDYYVAGFTNSTSRRSMHSHMGYGAGISKLDLTPQMTLDQAAKYTYGLPFGGTDCALPMIDALAKKIPADVFIVITDSETWAGNVHPTAALQEYRKKMGIDAKLIVMGMVSNGFTIADPADAGQLDIVGFDASVPSIIAQFVGVEDAVATEVEE